MLFCDIFLVHVFNTEPFLRVTGMRYPSKCLNLHEKIRTNLFAELLVGVFCCFFQMLSVFLIAFCFCVVIGFFVSHNEKYGCCGICLCLFVWKWRCFAQKIGTIFFD